MEQVLVDGAVGRESASCLNACGWHSSGRFLNGTIRIAIYSAAATRCGRSGCSNIAITVIITIGTWMRTVSITAAVCILRLIILRSAREWHRGSC